MPNIIQGNTEASLQLLADLKYDYPDGLDLRPSSDLHKSLKNHILARAREAAGIMSNRFDSWNKVDQTLNTYIASDADEDKVIDADARKPISIVFPYSYAILETLLSYMFAAFVQEPILRYEGVAPEDTMGAILLEKLIDLHCNKTKVPLALHTFFRDSFAYGISVGAPGWTVERGMKPVEHETGFTNWMGQFKSTGREREFEEGILFEGNNLENIDPYKYLPDPNTPIHKPQEAEFQGWVDNTNLMDLLSEERYDEDMFNVRYLKKLNGRKTSIYKDDNSHRTIKTGGSSVSVNNDVTNPVDVIYMYIKIIPKEWKLGSSEYPEKWLFGLAADEVIIKAKPVGLYHDKYPIITGAPDFDGYTATPLSRIEALYGLQHTLDWLFNSHIQNVRKAINDVLIVDPYSVNINDLKDPKPGKLIRLRRPAWGKGVKGAVEQLQVNDITRGNVADSALLVEWMQKIGATDNPMMGSLRTGGPDRLTSAEFQGTSAGAINRLERVAKVIGLQSMQDLGYFFGFHTQQLMSEEVYIKSIGRWERELKAEYGPKGVMTKPFDIMINYDVKVRDGSIPGGNFSQVWMQMFQALLTAPQFTTTFDIVRIFKHIARNTGAKNVDEFIKVEVRSDEQVSNDVQSGNIRPLNQVV